MGDLNLRVTENDLDVASAEVESFIYQSRLQGLDLFTGLGVSKGLVKTVEDLEAYIKEAILISDEVSVCLLWYIYGIYSAGIRDERISEGNL